MHRSEIDAGAAFDEVDRREDPKALLQHKRNEPAKAENPAEEHGGEDAAGSDGQRESTLEGARGQVELKGGKRPWPVGARTFFVVIGMVMAGIVVVLLWKARHVRKESESRREAAGSIGRVERHVPPLELAMAPPGPGLQAGAPGGGRLVSVEGQGTPPGGAAAGGDPPVPEAPGKADAAPQLSEAQKLEQRRLARGFGGEVGNVGVGEGEQAPPPSMTMPSPPVPPAPQVSGRGRGGAGLEEKLEPMQLRGASAGLLEDRDYLLTQGSMLDCVLETRLVSTAPGMTSCHLTRNIYSANGRVVLLDRGSKVVGHYQGGVQQGEARIFVVWSRVETPKGVVVELQSPGTGPLGEAGVDGWVDTHFWDRFGSAILLSLIQDASDAVASRAAGPGQSTISFSNQAAAGKQVVERSMEPTLNIAPTIVKNQGERVGIFVARDLDFRSVYSVERVARAGAGGGER